MFNDEKGCIFRKEVGSKCHEIYKHEVETTSDYLTNNWFSFQNCNIKRLWTHDSAIKFD